LSELTPADRLRVGVAFAPSPSPLFVVKDAAGAPRGVTVDLAEALAKQLGVPLELKVAPNTGELVDALEAGRIDVSFMPIDDERKKRIAFGPVYFEVESTYMVTAASGIRTIAEVDRAGVRVVGIANTTTIRAATRTLKTIVPVAAASIHDAMALMTTGQADAFALSRDSLPPFVAQLPGSRMVEGGVQFTGVAIAVGKGKAEALADVTAFLERAKQSGVVKDAFARAGLSHLDVAR
jgi:polar amino acid transport system substrate-binding protein